MKCFLALSVLFLSMSGTTRAQSCQSADSLFIPQGKPFKPKIGYDRMTDSAVAVVTSILKVPVFGDAGSVMLMAHSPGQTLGDSTFVRMTVEFSQQGDDGVVFGRSGPGALNTSMAKFAEVKDAKFLFDDSVRISLPLVSYNVSQKKAGVWYPEQLTETLTFLVPQSTRVQISRAFKGKTRIGTYEFDFGPNPIEGIRRFTRWEVCNIGVKPQ